MKIVINDESFSYDVYSLVKAFYQYEDVKTEIAGSVINKDASNGSGSDLQNETRRSLLDSTDKNSGQNTICPFSITFIFEEDEAHSNTQQNNTPPNNTEKNNTNSNNKEQNNIEKNNANSNNIENNTEQNSVFDVSALNKVDAPGQINHKDKFTTQSIQESNLTNECQTQSAKKNNFTNNIELQAVQKLNVVNVSETEDFEFENKLSLSTLTIPYENESRKDYKNKIKREIYRFLSERTGRQLPWGTLTGIRPTKLPMDLLFGESELSERNVKQYLKKTYLISDEKLDLSIEIAKREKGIIDRLHKDDGYSLYIGIPFCPTTCMYCSFTSFLITKWKTRMDDYLCALKKEIDYVSGHFADKKLDTIYIGGGTPTTLDAERLKALLSYINERLDTSNLLEFSVEAGRPDSITEEKLEALKNGGVTRISVNPQTMNEETLKLIGRSHTIDDFYRAYSLSQKYFDNINIDLILGLPGEDDAKVVHTFDEIAALAPNSLTVHSMAIKRAAHMDEFLKSHPEIKTEITDKMMISLHNMTAQLNLKPYYLYRQKNMTGNYENIGFAKDGFEGIYNILIMEEIQSIAALGAGSISKRIYPDGRIERCDNVKDVTQYIARIDEMIERKQKLFGSETET